MTKKLAGYQKQTNKYIFMTFGAIIFMISGTTTFSFFFTFFPNILAESAIGGQIAMLISGITGFILFDVATFVWLAFFLWGAETSEQRSISLGSTFVCFTSSAVASSAYLLLTSENLFELTERVENIVGATSIFIVVIGIIINFASVVLSNRYSKASKQAVRESDRNDDIQETIDSQLDELDAMVKVKVMENLKNEAKELADIRTSKIVERVKAREKNGTLSVEQLDQKVGEIIDENSIQENPALDPKA